jgi:hypothetical protein
MSFFLFRFFLFLGKASVTLASTSMASFFAIRPVGLLLSLIQVSSVPDSAVDRKNFGTILGNGDGMFKVGG